MRAQLARPENDPEPDEEFMDAEGIYPGLWRCAQQTGFRLRTLNPACCAHPIMAANTRVKDILRLSLTKW